MVLFRNSRLLLFGFQGGKKLNNDERRFLTNLDQCGQFNGIQGNYRLIIQNRLNSKHFKVGFEIKTIFKWILAKKLNGDLDQWGHVHGMQGFS